MNLRGAIILLNCSLILATHPVWESCCRAQASEDQTAASRPDGTNTANPPQTISDQGSNQSASDSTTSNSPEVDSTDTSNPLGVAFLKHLAQDQQAIWTSPAHLHWSDGSWLFPLAAAAGGFFASDRAVPPALSKSQASLNRYVSISNYGVYSLVAGSGGLYLLGKITRDEHKRETGILAGEAAIDALGDTTVLKYAFGRARPYQDNGLGNFFQGGTSFPSDHAAVAWSIASVIAHEYPGPLTEIGVYGLATVISATRVMGAQHFPSDVVVGGAIGWLIGRQVYRAHHDSELGGSDTGPLAGYYPDESVDRHHMGSTFVPLDYWVYPVFDRLVGLGYIDTAIMGMLPWTRMECARLTEEASENLQDVQNAPEEAAKLVAKLQQEFAYEIDLLGGGRNMSANIESVYARAVSISGPPLTDGYHFGQTIADDFGRPYEEGFNAQAGGSFAAEAGPLAIYIDAEYQHAPAAPALSPAVVNFISRVDGGVAVGGLAIPISDIPAGPFAAVNRLELLDTYATVNMNNWQLVLGKQSLDWGPSVNSMMWNDNIDPVNMARLVNPEPFSLPGFLHRLGGIKIDQFFGRLGGHPYIQRPFVYGQKITFKPFSFLEIGFARRTMIGGTALSNLSILNTGGAANALTTGNFLASFLGAQTGGRHGSVPGDTESQMDWTFFVPKTRNYIVLYGEGYAEDDVLPIQNPARNPWHPGLYITRIPGLPKLDFHIEGVSTEQNGLTPRVGGGNYGLFNYWNQNYGDGNTNYGYLIGNTVGRDGRAIQSWLTYWISASDTLQVNYKHSTVSSGFVPGGGAWQDYSVQNELILKNGLYVKGEVQYEHISSFPLLFNGPQNNISAILEVGFHPEKKTRPSLPAN